MATTTVPARRDSTGVLPTSTARATPLRVAVLATIIQRPAHVYDVAQRFKRRFGGEIFVTDKRVYQVVDDLIDAGLVEQLRPSAAERRRRRRAPRRPVRATAEGGATYRQWLIEQTHPEAQGVGVRVGVTAALMRGHDAALDLLRRYQDAVDRDLAVLVVASNDDLAEELLTEQRRIMLEGALKWAAFARERLSSTGTMAGGVAYAGR